MPSRQLAYRQGRVHESFLRNVRIEPAPLRRALKESWQADEPYDRVPNERTETWMETR